MMSESSSSSSSLITNTTMIDDGVKIQRWISPVPYLFGGLALMLVLIAIALLILACSFRSSSPSSSTSNDDNMIRHRRSRETPGSRLLSVEERENEEPKVVVIMAGDDKPTFLAKPLPSPMISFHFTDPHTAIERV